jgi:hypothetical protein
LPLKNLLKAIKMKEIGFIRYQKHFFPACHNSFTAPSFNEAVKGLSEASLDSELGRSILYMAGGKKKILNRSVQSHSLL